MLVSTTLLVFIVVGLTAMFVQTQKAFKAGTRQVTVTDSGRTVVDMISADLAQMSDAQNINITNLFWDWIPAYSTIMPVGGSSVAFRTNQEQEIFFLVQTNNQWLGVGYAMSNSAAGVGTLFRYYASVPAPLTNNVLFLNFYNAVISTNFVATNNFGRVAEGVIHLKIRAFDQNGNENFYEYGNDYALSAAFTYPLLYSNTLPNSVQLEVGVLDPDTYTQAKALAFNPLAQKNFLINAAANINVFRENIPIVGAAR
jgi:hypothetical protein